MQDISDRFNDYFNTISSDRFLNMEALGGEIPFYIAAYDAKNELTIRKATSGLKNKLNAAGKTVLEINLYDISCQILEEENKLEVLFKVEKRKSKAKLLKAVQSALNIHKRIQPYVKSMIDETKADVYFLTGIGSVYPFMRSHSVLYNLQNIAKDAPTVAFFPGEYSGEYLSLFSLMKDDNYYRAFDIDKIKQ